MHNGFTLIELVVVVFMIGILVTMSTGVVYFLLWQYPESLGNIGYINKSYSDIANDLMLVQYADKIGLDTGGIKLYFWDPQEQQFYTKHLTIVKTANYQIDAQTRTVTITIDTDVYTAHALREPIPIPKSIQVSASTTTVTLLFPAILQNVQLTPTGMLQCTSTLLLEEQTLCTKFTVPTATFTYTLYNIRDINLKPYTYQLQTVQMPSITVPALPAFMKENPL